MVWAAPGLESDHANEEILIYEVLNEVLETAGGSRGERTPPPRAWRLHEHIFCDGLMSAFGGKADIGKPFQKGRLDGYDPARQARYAAAGEYVTALRGVGDETTPRACAERTAEAV